MKKIRATATEIGEELAKRLRSPDVLDGDCSGDCLIFCVLSHTLPERVRSEYGEEHRGLFQGVAGSAVSGA